MSFYWPRAQAFRSSYFSPTQGSNWSSHNQIAVIFLFASLTPDDDAIIRRIPQTKNHEGAVVYVRNNKPHGDDLVRGDIARTLGISNLRDHLEEIQQNEESWYNCSMLAQALFNQ